MPAHSRMSDFESRVIAAAAAADAARQSSELWDFLDDCDSVPRVYELPDPQEPNYSALQADVAVPVADHTAGSPLVKGKRAGTVPLAPPPVPARESDSQAPTPEPNTLQILRQPPALWYQAGIRGRKIEVELKGRGNYDVSLLYADSRKPVPRRHSASTVETLKVIETKRGKSSTTLRIEVTEITRNHLGRLFCLGLSCGVKKVLTSPFEVRTKPTRPKRARPRSSSDDIEFRHRAQKIIRELAWHTIGYGGQGEKVDYNLPIQICPLCKSTKDIGHSESCQITQLFTL